MDTAYDYLLTFVKEIMPTDEERMRRKVMQCGRCIDEKWLKEKIFDEFKHEGVEVRRSVKMHCDRHGDYSKTGEADIVLVGPNSCMIVELKLAPTSRVWPAEVKKDVPDFVVADTWDKLKGSFLLIRKNKVWTINTTVQALVNEVYKQARIYAWSVHTKGFRNEESATGKEVLFACILLISNHVVKTDTYGFDDSADASGQDEEEEEENVAAAFA